MCIDDYGGWNIVLASQELELHMVMSHLARMLGIKLGSSGRATNALNNQPISPGPPPTAEAGICPPLD